MSRLESVNKPRFEIAKETPENNVGLVAVPLSLRKQVVEEFDQEHRWALYQEAEKKKANESSLNINAGMAEYLANAGLLFREKEFDLALEFYKSVLKIEPNNELAMKGLAECQSALGKHEEAIKVLQSLSLQSESATNYKMLGDELYMMEYFHDAIQAYHQSLNLNLVDSADLFAVYKNMGNALLRVGDDKGAEEYYNKAYTLQPDSDVLLVNFASLSVYKGDYEKALIRFREAVQINDKNDKAWVGLAMIHREYGDAELSWANLEKALDLNPRNSSAIRLVCEWALKDNEIEKAIIRITNYIETEPHDAQMIMWLSKFLYFDGRLEAALAQIEKVMQMNPDIEGAREVMRVVREEILAREAKLK